MLQVYQNEKVILVFGKTGVGKTSLLNTLFGLRWETDNAKACTTKLSSARHVIGAKTFLIVDLPGIAESEEADDLYQEIYNDAIPKADHIVWVFQGDTRVYRPDQVALLKFINLFKRKVMVTFCLNQIDRISPGDWNDVVNRPSKEQSKYIKEKIDDIYHKFKGYLPILEKEYILDVSAFKKYHIDELYRKLIDNENF